MGFSLFLIDAEQANLNKLDRKGLLHLSRIDKVMYYFLGLKKLDFGIFYRFFEYFKQSLTFNFSIKKVFHELEVVPLFGDMQIAPFNYVKKTPNFDASKWPLAMAASNSYATR